MDKDKRDKREDIFKLMLASEWAPWIIGTLGVLLVISGGYMLNG